MPASSASSPPPAPPRVPEMESTLLLTPRLLSGVCGLTSKWTGSPLDGMLQRGGAGRGGSGELTSTASSGMSGAVTAGEGEALAHRSSLLAEATRFRRAAMWCRGRGCRL